MSMKREFAFSLSLGLAQSNPSKAHTTLRHDSVSPHLTSKCAAPGSSHLCLGSVVSKVAEGGVGEESGKTGKQSPGHAELVLFPEPMGTLRS